MIIARTRLFIFGQYSFSANRGSSTRRTQAVNREEISVHWRDWRAIPWQANVVPANDANDRE